MKLASIPTDGKWHRDGRLVVVHKDQFAPVPEHIAINMAEAMQDWEATEPKLRAFHAQLANGDIKGTPVAGQRFLSPMPRSTCWIDGSAYIQHIILVRKARNAEPPETLRTVPLMYQGSAEPMLGPTDDIVVTSEDYGIDFESEVYVVLDEVPMGTKAEDAGQYIKLIGILNDVSLRNLIPAELKAGFGFFHGKPNSAHAPYLCTPDELGDAWKDCRVHLDLITHLNGKLHGNPNAGPEMHFGFHELIAHAAKTRPLPAGTVLGSGTVSNVDTSRGSSCLAETRMLEIINEGEAKTPFMKFGDTVKIEMFDANGENLFGTIEQTVRQA
ncbi:MAG: fumarylacetoacetate hydrolase family protein [Thermoplasmatota archaeon]